MSTLIHLFLDLENVQPTAAQLELVRGSDFRLWVLHGPQQTRFTADRVRAWQPLGEQVRFVQSAKTGKNALDLHIAFCLGETRQQDSMQDRKACYIVISQDKGFEALFEHVRGLGSPIGRADSLPEALKIAAGLVPEAVSEPRLIPIAVKVAPKSSNATGEANALARHVERVLADLALHPKNRPTTRKRLERHVVSILGHKIDEAVAAKVISELTRRSMLVFEGAKVRYVLRKARK